MATRKAAVKKTAQRKTREPATDERHIDILEMEEELIRVCLIGETGQIMHAMSEKVNRELMMPAPKKKRGELEAQLKHNLYDEFRDSMYQFGEDEPAPTAIYQKGVCFKKSYTGAAKDVAGATAAQVGRLSHVMEDKVSIYGIPQIHIDACRLANIQKTPDITCRAIVPEWACEFTVSVVKPFINVGIVTRLIALGGKIQGVGDYRVEKGGAAWGRYLIVDPDDERFLRIKEEGGREAQQEAIDNPTCYDAHTEKLLNWWESESKRRGFKVVV